MTPGTPPGALSTIFAGPALLHSEPGEFARGVLALIWGRVVFLVLLSVSVAVFNAQAILPPRSIEMRILAISIGAYFALSAAYLAVYYRWRRPLYWFALVQIMLDIPLWAVLVALTGGADSLFVFLFHTSILIAGAYCGGRGIVFALILGISLYVLQALLEPAELLPAALRPFAVNAEMDPSGFFFRLGMDIASMVLVAALTGLLVARASRAARRLQATEAIFKDLDKLNEAIISLVPSGLITADTEGRTRTVNRQALEMLGLEPREKGWQGTEITKMLAITMEELDASIRGKEVQAVVGGTPRLLEVSVSPIRGAGGNRAGSVIHLLDVTEGRALQRRIALMERDSALGGLAVRLAHEIRNPLGSISGSVEMIMQDASIGEEDRKLLRIVSAEAKRINALVASMLNLSKHEETLSVSAFSLGRLIDEIAAVFRSSDEAGGIDLHADVPASLTVEADREKIGQVLLNLLRNAAEAAANRDGGRVAVEAAEREDGKVEVRVIDDGPGVPRKDAEKIFDAYFTTKNLGVGLGLSVCRQIVQRHGETIGYHPGERGGSVFFFTLEKARPSQETSPVKSQA
jgi:two-component system sensor histidine kinase PilS (NtrC family)